MKRKIFLLSAVLTASLLAGAQSQSSDSLVSFWADLDEIEVSAQRIQQTTSNHESFSKEQLNSGNTGQNLPYLLSTTPGLQVTSDDGLGIGYTYFRVRGTDHTRINMTVNDVPLNDAESQTVFWVNMTDMAASMTGIDVQRGVGTSTNGSASFGASLNMSTLGSDTVNHFTLAFNGGMYNTFREMAQAHLVLPDKHWQLNARFSKVNSDGFLYHSASDLLSYHADLGYYGLKTQVVASFFGGSEKTGMAWDGVDYETAYGLNGADRRYNPSGEYKDPFTGETKVYQNQTDNYAQQHAQLNIKHRFSLNWSLNLTAHYTHGGGYYDQYKKKKPSDFGLSVTDNSKVLANYLKNLNNHYAGLVASAKYVNEHVDVQFGGAGSHYMGRHWGNLNYFGSPEANSSTLPINYEYYRASGNKTDANVFAKANWRVINTAQHKLSLYGDLQYRFIRYEMDGINDENLDSLHLVDNFHFFNPKAGITYETGGHMLYASFAIANREPSRANYKENVSYNPMTGEYEGDYPMPERLYDYELGYTYSHRLFSLGANLYFMDYDNQLVLLGDYNYNTGAMKTKNVKDSYRMGIELTAAIKPVEWFRWDGNLVLSRNKIIGYEQQMDIYSSETWDWVDQQTFSKELTTIAFSPSVTFMSLFTFDVKGFTANVQTNVTSKQYLDNTERESAMLKAFTTTNLNLQYAFPTTCKGKTIPEIRLLCQVNNIFNAKYASNGGADASAFDTVDGAHPWAWYYAQAGINVHAGFVVAF